MEWYRAVQFVSAVPMPVERAREYGTTVNGMWDDPARWDRSAVDQAHQEGRRVLVSVPLIALTSRYYEREEERHLLNEMCRDISGNPAEVKWYYWDSKPVYAMCLYSRVFRDHLLAKIQKAIEGGADVVNVDEIQTSIGLMSREHKDPGFCPKCLEKFCAHIEGDPSARNAASVRDVGELRADGYRVLLQCLRENDALYRQYVAFHQAAAFETAAEFLREVRACIARAKSEMAVTANLTGIGTFLEANGRLWGAAWGELIDFVMMENIYVVDPGAFHTGPGHHLLPRGKFTAWYRLASALGGKAPAWITPQIYVPKQLAGRKSVSYYLLMFLEAYANNGRWGYYWWPGVDERTRLEATVPELVKDYTRFILKHRTYYEECSTDNKIAILYADSAVLANPKGHHKYLALAQALAEAGYQYDVIYAGDDVFTPSEIAADQLARYQAVLLAEAGQLTESQRDALRAYARNGGQVIVYSAHEMGAIPGMSTISDDRLLDFWREYRDEQRAAVIAPLGQFGGLPVTTSDADVNVVIYSRGEAVICHVLNYDYREADDTITPKRNVKVGIPWSAGEKPAEVRWLTLQREEVLPCHMDRDRLEFTIPSIDPYGLAVINSGG
jgi:hypothetical protein